jgi:adenylate kinase
VNVLLLGPPGSGKGTQATRLADAYALAYIGLGEMLRASATAGRLGELEPLLAEGELLPDDVVIGLIRERLAQDDAEPGFVLDGFPRSLAQGQALDLLLDELGRPLTIVLELRVPDGKCMERLLARGHESGRSDDVRDVILRRLDLYHRETEPLVGYYEASGRRIVGLHGERSPDEVWGEIETAVDSARRA